MKFNLCKEDFNLSGMENFNQFLFIFTELTQFDVTLHKFVLNSRILKAFTKFSRN